MNVTSIQAPHRVATACTALLTLALAPLSQAGPCASSNQSLPGLAHDLARSAENLERAAQVTMGTRPGKGRGNAYGLSKRGQSNGQFLAALDSLTDATSHLRQAVLRRDHSFTRLQGEVHETDRLFDSITGMGRYLDLSQPVRIQMGRTKTLLDAFHQNLERNYAPASTPGNVNRGGGYRTTSYGGAAHSPTRVPKAIRVETSRRF